MTASRYFATVAAMAFASAAITVCIHDYSNRVAVYELNRMTVHQAGGADFDAPDSFYGREDCEHARGEYPAFNEQNERQFTFCKRA